MRTRRPKSKQDYYWTRHALEKIRHYGLTESRLKKILINPDRQEIGIAPNTIAVMQAVGRKRKTEIWLMYKEEKGVKKIITAWRYPGVSLPKEETMPSNKGF